MNRHVAVLVAGSWCGLGFYRGYCSYETKDIAYTNKLRAIGYGVCGVFVYINPLALPLILESEYKRLRK